jgi:STAM-binding protein
MKKASSNEMYTSAAGAANSLSESELEELKRKYNLENEHELRLLQEKQKINQTEPQKVGVDIEAAKANVPQIDRNLKPKPHTNNYNFRTIIVPADLTPKFLDLAQSNTTRNVETCGILAGKLNQNVFTLSHCIIPKQSGSSDTCTTEQEHELFDTIDELNLITLGWIHTHPSQTAFLSSIDLHTHYGYQIMIPEAIAIVCAPSFNENKFFILSPDYGLKEIGECSKSGFHPHTINPALFEECEHVRENSNLRTSMIDLRIVTNRIF